MKSKALAYHSGMLFIHYKHLTAFLDSKDDEALAHYSNVEFHGAQHHARELLKALDGQAEQGSALEKLIGKGPREAVTFNLFIGQLAYVAEGKAAKAPMEAIGTARFLSTLCQIAELAGPEGFSVFGDATADWFAKQFKALQQSLSA